MKREGLTWTEAEVAIQQGCIVARPTWDGYKFYNKNGEIWFHNPDLREGNRDLRLLGLDRYEIERVQSYNDWYIVLDEGKKSGLSPVKGSVEDPAAFEKAMRDRRDEIFRQMCG